MLASRHLRLRELSAPKDQKRLRRGLRRGPKVLRRSVLCRGGPSRPDSIKEHQVSGLNLTWGVLRKTGGFVGFYKMD